MLNPFPHAVPNPYGYMPPPPHPFHHLHHPPRLHAPPMLQAPVTVSPPIELPRIILLEEFLQRYKLNMEDQRVLSELGYVPGDDAIDQLDTVTWEGTRVLPLTKARILRYHKTFLKDIAQGLWN
ncbi:hypothetical protein DFH07DRAFT_1019376 [Mycena maculata]|uniref:Uncharacterized protein n=1 Tax=Mycena maculata TaxID=230809 RepID=A0AAD7MDZ4_9AGAR|nr:hypothetical protein DFH07DRAFT_1019376 [Mycena maculata]